MVFYYFVKCQLKFIRFVCKKKASCNVWWFWRLKSRFLIGIWIFISIIQYACELNCNYDDKTGPNNNLKSRKFIFNVVPYQTKTMTSQSPSIICIIKKRKTWMHFRFHSELHMLTYFNTKKKQKYIQMLFCLNAEADYLLMFRFFTFIFDFIF